MKKILTTIIIIVAFAGCSRCTNNYDCGSDRCITGRFIESVSIFDNFNHTGEFEFPELANDPVDLDAECRRCVDSLGTDMEIVMSIRTSCDMMKAYVHLKGMALRAVAPKETVEALDRFEAAFDTLFHRCVSQEYYLRLFQDCFNETIPDSLDSLVASCRKFALKEPGSPNDGAVRLRRSTPDKQFSTINRTYHKLLNICVPDDKSGRIEYEKKVRFRLSHLTDSIEKCTLLTHNRFAHAQMGSLDRYRNRKIHKLKDAIVRKYKGFLVYDIFRTMASSEYSFHSRSSSLTGEEPKNRT